jgi:hypothetical protein
MDKQTFIHTLTFTAVKAVCEEDYRKVPPEIQEVCWQQFVSEWQQLLKKVDKQHIDDIERSVTGGEEVYIRRCKPPIRALLHQFCEALGLSHVSEGKGKCRTMTVKPPVPDVVWKWTFGEAEKVKARKRLQLKQQEAFAAWQRNKMRRYSCDNCSVGWSDECELYESVSWCGIYCEECVNSLTCADIMYNCGVRKNCPLNVYKVEAISSTLYYL